ncbi:unnamed protein product [Cyprideis torosa]|uniref:Protein Wnt n=1 Tax=Cyprideis torosa TaxID=163714 RepID=A0A7R8W0D6_9CRUS|nr:unnamed protein product [Cyprideis torosa]CAG0879643.1 unnamed protein product [Cyprideis torosa]
MLPTRILMLNAMLLILSLSSRVLGTWCVSPSSQRQPQFSASAPVLSVSPSSQRQPQFSASAPGLSVSPRSERQPQFSASALVLSVSPRFLSQLESTGSEEGDSLKVRIFCHNIPDLVKKQRKLCLKHPDVMVSVGQGAKIGVRECQHQFQNHRWNCSTVQRDASVFGRNLVEGGSREAAFVYAVSSAAVAYTVSRSCSKGELDTCHCDHRIKQGDPIVKARHTRHLRRGAGEAGKPLSPDFAWGGCSENVRYGTTFARRFVDAREKDNGTSRHRDPKSLMNLHNNRIGRQAVRKHLRLQCKCHGVSGSCTLQTCWLALTEFRRVGDYLRRKYDTAIEVTMNQDIHKGPELVATANQSPRRSVTRRFHIPKQSDLVYLDVSPDYCNPVEGHPGIGGRECNRTSRGADSCDTLCCGRGYDTSPVLVTTRCRCRFHWCCRVECQQCNEWREIHTCKGESDVVQKLPILRRTSTRRSGRRRGRDYPTVACSVTTRIDLPVVPVKLQTSRH